MAVIYWPSLTVLFSVFVDYILAQSNITLDFDCIEHVSNSLPVTITDMDGVVLIPLYNMRTGIDLEKNVQKTGWGVYQNKDNGSFSAVLLVVDSESELSGQGQKHPGTFAAKNPDKNRSRTGFRPCCPLNSDYSEPEIRNLDHYKPILIPFIGCQLVIFTSRS